MSNAARRPLTPAAIRAINARRAAARAANDGVVANDNARVSKTAKRTMPKGLLADCIAAGGFDQNARFA